MDAVRLTFTDPRLGAVVMPVGYEVTYVPGHVRPSDTPIYDQLVEEVLAWQLDAAPLEQSPKQKLKLR